MSNPVLDRAKKVNETAGKPVVSGASVVPDTAPNVIKGEMPSSRPFRLTKMLGALAGVIQPEQAKVELELLAGFRKALDEFPGCNPNTAGYAQFPGEAAMLPDEVRTHKATNEFFAHMRAGAKDTDLDQLLWEARKVDKALIEKGYEARYEKTAMSYLTDTTGGALVAPPVQGEVIPLMRNQSAVDRAGGRMVPLPPQGKWVAPRITSPTTGYWIGENTNITQSNPTTGEVAMQAKKLAVLTLLPNELFKYASGATDAMIRDDMSKTLALGFDYAVLYGTGSGNQPKGLVRYTGSNEVIDYSAVTPTPKGLGNDGNTVQPQDGYRMAADVFDRNFEVNPFKFIMRPRLWGVVASRRADAVTTGDQAGPFAQAITRLLGDSVGSNWCGYEVIQSSQVRNDQTKGSGTGLTEIWGGCWNELLLGMYGAIEFMATNQGNTLVTADQTLIRGLVHCDSVPRYPGAFIYYPSLLFS